MSPRELIAWASLDDRRRRAHGTGPTSWAAWQKQLLFGVLFAVELLRRGSDLSSGEGAGVSAGALFLTVLLASSVLTFFGAPHRMYWRRDSRLLATLSLTGRALYSLALVRSLRASLMYTVPLILSAPVLLLSMPVEQAIRFAGLVALAFLTTSLFAPAVALGAGALVASEQAQSALASMGGEFQAPKNTWLGALPGFASAAFACVLLAMFPWARGGSAAALPALQWFVISAGVIAGTSAWSWSRCDQVMVVATREVSALDQELLAHIERSTPSALERLAVSLRLGGRGALLAHKDMSLARRRYPSYYMLSVLGVILIWGLQLNGGATSLSIANALLFCLSVYVGLMALRGNAPPIEAPRLLATLPIASCEVVAAKSLLTWLRAAVVILVGGGALFINVKEAGLVNTVAPLALSAAIVIAFAAVAASRAGESA